MKRFAKVVAVVLVAVMTLTVLVACGYSSDPDKAVEQLERQGYQVQYILSFSNDIDAIVDGFKKDDKVFTYINITYYTEIYKAKDAYWKEKVPEFVDSGYSMRKTVSRHGKQVVVKRIFYEISH